MNLPEHLQSTYRMLQKSFPESVNDESYRAILYLLYEYMSDENLSLVMSFLVNKPSYEIENDIYQIYYIPPDKETVSEVEQRLCRNGFKEWKKEDS